MKNEGCGFVFILTCSCQTEFKSIDKCFTSLSTSKTSDPGPKPYLHKRITDNTIAGTHELLVKDNQMLMILKTERKVLIYEISVRQPAISGQDKRIGTGIRL